MKITENDFQNFQKQHFPSLFKPCFICVQQVVVLYARNVLYYNLNYVELNQYCLLLFSKKGTMQVITATVTNVFISASKYKKIQDKSIKKF